MNTFTVVHAVDTSTGVAVIGKAHVIEKREELIAASYSRRITAAAERKREYERDGSSSKL